MQDQFSRTRLLLGQEKMRRLFDSRVAIFGIGGVGGFAAEALARSGVGRFLLVDSDRVGVTNINRQIIATHKTLGLPKVSVMKERILDINPAAIVETRECFFLPQNADSFDFSDFSYVIDAVDTVSAKIEIVVQAQRSGVPVISAMGAGNKRDPTKFAVADIYRTSVCPLARVMRRECKKRGVKALKVVYSTEAPERAFFCDEPADDLPAASLGRPDGGLEERRANLSDDFGGGQAVKKNPPASLAFVPSVAGLVIAGEVVKDLTRD